MAALSLKYRLLKGAVRLLGIKKTFQQPPEVLLERARREAAKVRIPHLEDARIRTEVREIGGAKAMMTKGKDMPPYMLYLEDGDYRGLREVYLCYGSDEVLYAACDPVLQALKRDGVRVTLEIGKGMFHCYPLFPMVKESKEAWDRMIAYIRA